MGPPRPLPGAADGSHREATTGLGASRACARALRPPIAQDDTCPDVQRRRPRRRRERYVIALHADGVTDRRPPPPYRSCHLRRVGPLGALRGIPGGPGPGGRPTRLHLPLPAHIGGLHTCPGRGRGRGRYRLEDAAAVPAPPPGVPLPRRAVRLEGGDPPRCLLRAPPRSSPRCCWRDGGSQGRWGGRRSGEAPAGRSECE